MKERLAKAVFWITWSRGAGQLVSFVSTLLVARLLVPADYGLMALAGIWTGIMMLLSEMGLGAAIVQFQDLNNVDLNSCFWLTMSVAGAAYLALYVAAPSIEMWFAASRLSEVLRVIGLILPLVAVRVVPESLLRKELAFDRLSQATVIATMVTVPVVVGMAWSGAGVWALATGAVVAPVVQDILVFWFGKWVPGFRIGGTRFHDLMRYSLATLGSRVCWATYQQSDTFVLGKVSGDTVVGFYSMAKELAALPVSRISAVVNQLASPVMAELQTSREALRGSLFQSLRLVTAVSLPICVGLMLEADDLVHLVLTDKWIASVPILRILCWYSILSMVAVLFVPVLMARYRAAFVLRYMMAQLVLMPIAFWAGARFFGAVGVAVAWAVVYPIGFTWLTREVARELETGWRTILGQCKPAITATASMALVVLLCRLGWQSLGKDGGLSRLALAVAAGASVYGSAMWWFGGSVRGEILEVAGWIVRGRVRRRT